MHRKDRLPLSQDEKKDYLSLSLFLTSSNFSPFDIKYQKDVIILRRRWRSPQIDIVEVIREGVELLLKTLLSKRQSIKHFFQILVLSVQSSNVFISESYGLLSRLIVGLLKVHLKTIQTLLKTLLNRCRIWIKETS